MPEPSPISRFFKEPLVQFLLIGGCIYGAFFLFGEPEEEVSENKIHVDDQRIEAFITEWQKRWNRPPTREEIDGVVQNYIREEVLYRQAVSMGLGEDDPITRRRMAQKLEFLTSDLAQAQVPEDAELKKYFADNAATYRAPDVISFSQVFFNPDSRKAATLEDAKAELEKLIAAGKPNPETLKAGDKLMLKSYYPSVTEAEIRRQMGVGFSEAVMKLEAGEWHGPVLSGFGTHLVYIYDIQKGAMPEFESVKEKVLQAWQDERRESFNGEFLENLKGRFEIVVDELPADRLIDGAAEPMPKKETEAPVVSES